MWLEMKVKGLALDPLSNMPIIVLRDEEEKRSLPIWVGLFEANAIALDHDGRIVAAGQAEFDAPDNDFAWLRIESSYIFADGFEWVDTSRWSATAP